MNCFALTPTASGTLTISGVGVLCRRVLGEPQRDPRSGFEEVCNTTTITVEIDGHPVSVTAQKGSTNASVAFDLAHAIASDPYLLSIVDVAVLDNQITVRAQQEGWEHAYPWFSTCTYIQDFFSACGFKADRSPISTLAFLPE